MSSELGLRLGLQPSSGYLCLLDLPLMHIMHFFSLLVCVVFFVNSAKMHF